MPTNNFLAFIAIPNPLPASWNNGNVWHPCLINGVNLGGKVTLNDQSHNPATNVSWSTFLGNPTNPNWVPQYAGPDLAGHPNQAINLSITLMPIGGRSPVPYKWAGYESVRVGPLGGYIVTGFSYDAGAYPQ